MSPGGWEGAGALRLLLMMRLKARLRRSAASLRSPKRILLTLFVISFAGLVAVSQNREGSTALLSGGSGSLLLPLFVSFFLLATIIGAAANGVLSFSPAEIHFLFPGPLGTRTLLASHLVVGTLKSVSAAVVCALFLRPGGASFLRTIGSYQLLFTLLILASLVMDLAWIGLARRVRRRRSILVVCVLVVVGALAVCATWILDGRLGPETFRCLGWPGMPFVVVLTASELREVLAHLGILATLCTLLFLRVIFFKGNIREAADQTSERVQKMLARIQSGTFMLDKPAQVTRGVILPMLPRLGGAGVHAWRQLSVLIRQRRSYLLLTLMCVFAGGASYLGPYDGGAEVSAMIMVFLAAVAGPMYVQCDFRSDYENLIYLRSLPTRPMALAAGQMLASCIVLCLLQLLLGSWVVFVAAPDRRVIWLGIYLCLPILNMIQLCVENGAYLLFPVSLQPAKGPPGIFEFGRMYVLMITKLLVLGTVVAVAGIPGLLVWKGLGLPVVGAILSLVLALAEALALVYLVGRIFARSNQNR